jgi:hypothetical protein
MSERDRNALAFYDGVFYYCGYNVLWRMAGIHKNDYKVLKIILFIIIKLTQV